MNRGTLWIALLSIVALGVVGCGGSSHRVTITSAPTTLTAGTSSNVVAVTSHDPSDQLNWTCTPVGACGSFNPTETANGSASVYTAPPVAPSGGGPVTITATSVNHPSRSASVTIAITGVATANFVFYASGIGECDEEECPYSVAGVVAIAQDGSGTVVGGEQDFNDGVDAPVPQDPITSGQLTLADDGSGNATLTISTTSGDTETFALNYANANHALIIEFDGFATSSGSFDLQSSTTAPVNGSFAFVATGSSGEAIIEEGGVITLDNGAITGTFDRNNAGTPNTGQPIPEGASIGSTDPFGRGVVTGLTDVDTTIAYYVVGPEVLRLISTDAGGQAVGSSYGQGTTAGSFSGASIGNSVFSIGSTLDAYAAVGQFSTSTDDGTVRHKGPVREGEPVTCVGLVLCDFIGVADENFEGTSSPALPIAGTYTIAANGYGSLNFTTSFDDATQTFGVYAVDPSLNILDPNDKTDGTGGALIAEMDNNFFGIGSIVPQTDPSAGSFVGNYTFGGQGAGQSGPEFDFVGSGTVTAGPGTFTGTGALNDLFEVITDTSAQYPNATFTASPVADPDNTGRYTMDPFTISDTTDDFSTPISSTLYQAEGGQLFWIDMDESDVGIGSWESQTTSGSLARKAQAKTKTGKQ